MVGLFGHLGCEVGVGTSEVSHFLPDLRCFLGKVGKRLLCTNPVVGSIAALTRFFMLISEVGSGFNEMGLEVFPGFFLCVLYA